MNYILVYKLTIYTAYLVCPRIIWPDFISPCWCYPDLIEHCPPIDVSTSYAALEFRFQSGF